MKTNSKYISDDGTAFDKLSDCVSHERNLNWNQQPTRKKILDTINDHLQQVYDNSKNKSFDYALKYQNKAEALIEILESLDCGSHGGFDPQDPNCGKHYGPEVDELKSRFKWLKDKYSKQSNKNN